MDNPKRTVKVCLLTNLRNIFKFREWEGGAVVKNYNFKENNGKVKIRTLMRYSN